MEIAGQIISIMGVALLFVSFQMKSNGKLFLIQIFSGAAFMTSFLLLGDLSGAAANAVGVLRCVLFLAFKNRKNPTVCILVEAAFVLVCVFTYVNVFSVLVTLAQMASTVTLWSDNGKAIRWVQLCVTSPLWLANNIYVLSIGGIVGEVVNMTSSVIALIRFRKSGFEGVSVKQTAAQEQPPLPKE